MTELALDRDITTDYADRNDRRSRDRSSGDARSESASAVVRSFLKDPRLVAYLSTIPAVLALSLLVLSPRQLWLPIAALMGFGIAFILPLKYSLFAYFMYMAMEGAFKINSNYNPVAQLGGDMLLMILLVRACLDKSTGGVGKITQTPFVKLIAIYAVWVFIQYANPLGLGLIPSIAGSKIYVGMLPLFFLTYHYLDRREFELLFICLVGITCVESTLAVIEYIFGQDFMLSLHPRYKATAGIRFVGSLYRPFGTTAVPGTPSSWIYLSTPMAMYLLIRPKASLPTMLLAGYYFAIAVPALIFCQIRTAMVLFALGIIGVAAFPGPGLRKRMSRIVALFAVGIIGLLPQLKAVFLQDDAGENDKVALMQNALSKGEIAGKKLSGKQIQKLADRLGSLGKTESFKNARTGAIEGMVELGSQTLFGIGLSRVGAAAIPWESLIKADPRFGSKWSFADNLYRTIFTEIGLTGLVAWALMIFSFIIYFFRQAFERNAGFDNFKVWTSAIMLVLLLIGGWGSEGILYTPMSCFFWTYIASALKEVTNVAV